MQVWGILSLLIAPNRFFVYIDFFLLPLYNKKDRKGAFGALEKVLEES